MLLTRLKSETRAIHQKLHEVVDLHCLQDSLSTYQSSLLAYLQAIAPLEQVASRILAGQHSSDGSANLRLPATDFDKRLLKSSWLIGDLQHFGWDATELANWFATPEHADQRPFPSSLIQEFASQHLDAQQIDIQQLIATTGNYPAELTAVDRSTFTGICYVCEGMTLGSSRIYPLVASAHQLSEQKGARFFYAYGDAETAQQHWQQFRDWVDQQSLEEDRVVSAAVETFRWFETVLSNWKTSKPSVRHA